MAGAISSIEEDSYHAETALSKNKFVELSSSDSQKVKAVTTQGQTVCGVIQTDVSSAEATAGKAVAVQVHGVAWVIAGTGGVSLGAEVMVDATGGVVAATSTNRVVGRVKAAASAGGLALIGLSGHTQPVKP